MLTAGGRQMTSLCWVNSQVYAYNNNKFLYNFIMYLYGNEIIYIKNYIDIRL